MYTVEPSPCYTKLMVSLNGEVQFLVEWDGPSYILETVKTNVNRIIEKANTPIRKTCRTPNKNTPTKRFPQVLVFGYDIYVDGLAEYLATHYIFSHFEQLPEGKAKLYVKTDELEQAKRLMEQYSSEE